MGRGGRLFAKDEKNEIIAAMQDAYDSAPANGVTRKMFEKWVLLRGRK
jgi:hypothetical protein